MFRADVWLITTLISIGIIGGLLFNWPSAEPAPEREDPSQRLTTSDTPPPPLFPEIPDDESEPFNLDQGTYLERADKFLMVGNYVRAHDNYLKLVNQSGESDSALLLLKLGYSAEQAGYLSQSESYYRRAVKSAGDRILFRLYAMSGLSRVWFEKGQVDEAFDILSLLYLKYGTNSELPRELRLQILYQMVVVVQRQFLDTQLIAPGATKAVEFLWCEPQMEEVLFLNLEDFAAELVSNTDAIRLLQRPAEDINLIAVEARTPLTPMSKLLDKLAETSKVEFTFTRRATDALIGRSVQIEVTGASLAMMLDQLVAPLGLVWDQVGKQVRIRSKNEQPDQVASYRFQQAIRLMRQIEIEFDGDFRSSTTLLHRGNLHLLADDLDSAGIQYQKLAQQGPAHELSAKLSFNMAKLDMLTGRFGEAVDRFYYTVDQSMNIGLQAKSYGWIGKIELERANATRAIYAASRGASLGGEPIVHQRNIMNLAKAYLLDSDPFTANKVLFDNADTILGEKTKRLAAVLSSYARYLGTTESLGLANEGERLVTALAAIENGDVKSFIDQLIIGRAFFEVGFTSRSTELMEMALDTVQDEVWKRRILYELAIQKQRAGDVDAAKKYFSELATGLDDSLKVPSKLALAKIFLLQKDGQSSLNLCNSIWQDELDQNQKVQTLELMGHAYSQLGRPHAAAICFSGMLPANVSEANLRVPVTEANEGGNDGR